MHIYLYIRPSVSVFGLQPKITIDNNNTTLVHPKSSMSITKETLRLYEGISKVTEWDGKVQGYYLHTLEGWVVTQCSFLEIVQLFR